MFSSTTIASSTTRPIASTIASSVSVLIVKPKAYISANEPTSDTGIVTSGISVARRLRRKKKITSTTSTTASAIVVNTESIERSMNTDESYAMLILMPCGRVSLIFGDLGAHRLRQLERVAGRLLDHAHVDRRLAVEARDHALLGGADADVGDVAQPHRVALRRSRRSGSRTARACCRSVAATIENSRLADSMRPDGSSTFWRRSASSTS
jgi:hypothetical protein